MSKVKDKINRIKKCLLFKTKSLQIIQFSWTVIILCCLSANADCSTNMLEDGGFEGQGQYGCGQGWALGGWGDRSAKISRDNVQPASGKHSLRVDIKYCKTGSVFVIGKLKGIKTGKYRLSVKMKGTGTFLEPVLFCVRSIGHPYRRYLEGKFMPTNKWKQYSVESKTLDNKNEPVAFYISMHPTSTATVWLDDIILEKLPEPKIAALPDNTYGNILRNGDFEVYMGRNWVAQGNCSRIISSKAVSGKCVLQIKFDSGRKVKLASTCFSVPTSREYYLGISSFAKGDAELKMNLFSANGDELVTTLDATPQVRQNKMTSFKCKVKLPKGVYYCVLEASGKPSAELLIDAVNVVDGKNYMFKGLDCGFSTDKEANIFSPDKAAILKLEIFNHGKSINKKLTLSVTDLMGKDVYRESPIILLKRQQLTKHEFKFTLKEKGAFMAKLIDDKKILSRINFSVLPRPNQIPAKRSVFGGHMSTNKFSLDVAKRMGIKWARLHDCSTATYWSDVEPLRGKFLFQDNNIRQYKDAGFMILGVLYRIPGWANGNKGRAVPPKNNNDFAKFSEVLVTHYKNSIKHWEVMNEPYMLSFWKGTPQEYATLAKIVSKAVKKADPEATTLTMCTAPTCVDFSEATLKAGALDNADVMSYHAYDQTSWKNYPNILKWAGKHPVWNTETGITVKSFYNNLPEVMNKYTLANKGIDVVQGASNTVKLVALSLGIGAKRFFFYWNVYEPNLGPRLSSMCAFEYDKSLRPHAVAYAIAINLLDPCTGDDILTHAGLVAIPLQKKNETIMIIWNEKGYSNINLSGLPANSKVIDIMGNTVALKQSNLRVGSIPFYIIMPKSDKVVVKKIFKEIKSVIHNSRTVPNKKNC